MKHLTYGEDVGLGRATETHEKRMLMLAEEKREREKKAKTTPKKSENIKQKSFSDVTSSPFVLIYNGAHQIAAHVARSTDKGSR